jgi:hypothetical protein
LIAAPPEDESCSCNVCPHMKRNTLEKLYLCMRDMTPQVDVPEPVRVRALKPIERMLEMSGEARSGRAALLLACGRSEVAVEPTHRGSTAGPADAAPTILGDTRELITAVTADWTSTKATLRRFRRDGAAWKLIGAEWPGVVGRSGTAWGSGVHGVGAPAGRSGPIKREGEAIQRARSRSARATATRRPRPPGRASRIRPSTTRGSASTIRPRVTTTPSSISARRRSTGSPPRR